MNPIVEIAVAGNQRSIHLIPRGIVERIAYAHADDIAIGKFLKQQPRLTRDHFGQLILRRFAIDLLIDAAQNHAVDLRDDVDDRMRRYRYRYGADAFMVDLQQHALAPVAGGGIARFHQQTFFDHRFDDRTHAGGTIIGKRDQLGAADRPQMIDHIQNQILLMGMVIVQHFVRSRM